MKSQSPRLAPRRVIVFFVVALTLALVLFGEGMKPVARAVAVRYVARGDVYLAQLEFDQARNEYEKALAYDASNTEAKAHRDLAVISRTDIAAGRDFFAQHDVQSVINRIDRAQQAYAEPKEALSVGVQFYAAGEFVYAQYPLRRAVELDPKYPEAWHYLALTYQELSKVDPSFDEKAADALRHRDLLTPKYIDN